MNFDELSEENKVAVMDAAAWAVETFAFLRATEALAAVGVKHNAADLIAGMSIMTRAAPYGVKEIGSTKAQAEMQNIYRMLTSLQN